MLFLIFLKQIEYRSNLKFVKIYDDFTELFRYVQKIDSIFIFKIFRRNLKRTKVVKELYFVDMQFLDNNQNFIVYETTTFE